MIYFLVKRDFQYSADMIALSLTNTLIFNSVNNVSMIGLFHFHLEYEEMKK